MRVPPKKDLILVLLGAAVVLMIVLVSPERKRTSVVIPPKTSKLFNYRSLARPSTSYAFNTVDETTTEPSRVAHSSILYHDGIPLKMHREIARVDLFTYTDPGMPPSVNYAFWGDSCESHIVANTRKSAEWLAVDKFLHFKQLIRPGSVALDIGAQQGDTTVLMAPFAGLTIAFEPHPRIFIATQTNADVNPLFNIHAYNVAASPTGEDYQEKWCYGCNGGADSVGSKECFEATIVNIPAFLASLYPDDVTHNIGFIKIDTEGFDTRVLRTLAPLLEVNDPKPVIFLEWYENHTSREARQTYIDAFESIGYQPYEIDGVTPIENLLTHEKRRDIVIRPR